MPWPVFLGIFLGVVFGIEIATFIESRLEWTLVLKRIAYESDHVQAWIAWNFKSNTPMPQGYSNISWTSAVSSTYQWIEPRRLHPAVRRSSHSLMQTAQCLQTAFPFDKSPLPEKFWRDLIAQLEGYAMGTLVIAEGKLLCPDFDAIILKAEHAEGRNLSALWRATEGIGDDITWSATREGPHFYYNLHKFLARLAAIKFYHDTEIPNPEGAFVK